MNRRTLLAASAASTFLWTSGCIDRLDPRDENSTGTDDVPNCTSKEEWPDDITSGPTQPDPDSIAGRRDCATADRPEPTGDVCETFEVETQGGETYEYHSVGITPYPEPVTNFNEESLTAYVYEYEDAFQQNAAVSRYGERATGAGADIMEDSTRVLNLYDEITTIGIGFAPPVTYRTIDGDIVGDDNFGDHAVYGVDETGIVRLHERYLDSDGEIVEDTPDPVEDGDLLECF